MAPAPAPAAEGNNTAAAPSAPWPLIEKSTDDWIDGLIDRSIIDQSIDRTIDP